MKKLLLATTAIVAMTGAAAAEVSISGDARIGLRYESDIPYSGEFCEFDGIGYADCYGTNDSWNVVSRIRVEFAMSGETDSGLSFGANIRADQAGGQGSNGNASIWKGDVWLSGTYGKLTAGDVDSAIAMALGHLPYIGVSELNDYNEFYHTTSDYDSEVFNESGLTYEYQFGNATVYASFLDRNENQSSRERKGQTWSLGGTYDFNNFSVAAGYEKSGLFIDPIAYTVGSHYGQDEGIQNAGLPWDSDTYTTFANDTKSWGLRGSADFQGLSLIAIYTQTDVDGENNPWSWSEDKYKVRQYGIGAEYEFDNGIGVQAYYRYIKGDSHTLVNGVDFTAPDATYKNKANLYGLGMTYDLGGGATLLAGIAHSKGDSSNAAVGSWNWDSSAGDYVYDSSFKHTLADVGLQMKF